MLKVFIPVLTMVAVSACATVTKGTRENVSFISNPPGARVETTLGSSCTTPCSIKIPRRDNFIAKFFLNNEVRAIAVDSRLSGSGAAGITSSLVLAGPVGLSVDALSGATREHVPSPVSADFSKPQSKQITADLFVKERIKQAEARKANYSRSTSDR